MSDYLPNPNVLALIAPRDAPRYGDPRYSFLGGRGTDDVPRCNHGWPAILKWDGKVYGCAGHIANDPVTQPDGLACGFYMRSEDRAH